MKEIVVFCEEKKTTLARIILPKMGTQYPYIRVMTPLYLIDEKMLEQYNNAISLIRKRVIKNIAILSNTLNLINFDSTEKKNNKYILNKNLCLSLMDELEPQHNASLAQKKTQSRNIITDHFWGKRIYGIWFCYTHENYPKWRNFTPFEIRKLPLREIFLPLNRLKVLKKFISRRLGTMDNLL